MANRDCQGDYFTANGVRYYRCFWDGEVIQAPQGTCPHCERVIDANSDQGSVPTVEHMFAVLQGGQLAMLPPSGNDGDKDKA